MFIPVRTTDDIIKLLRDDIRNLYSGLNVVDHAVAYDIGLRPAGVIGEKLFFLADFVDRTRSLTGISEILQDDNYRNLIMINLELANMEAVDTLLDRLLEGLVGNWRVTRNPALKARVPVRFYGTSNAALTVPVGKRGTTRGSNPIVFLTVGSTIAATPTYDASKGMYYVEVMCEAQVAGISGMVAADRITILLDTIAGVSQISNPIPSYGGADAESDQALISRASTVWRSWSLDTKGGLESWVEEQPGVEDGYVAKPSDPLTSRTGYTAPVDLFVSVNSNPVQVTDQIPVMDAQALARIAIANNEARAYPPTTGASFDYYMNLNPVISVQSVSSTTVSAVTFTTTLDSTSPVSGSPRSRSFVTITTTGVPSGDTLFITYTYDSRILSLQNTLDSPDYDLMSTDTLIRKGQVMYVNITGDVRAISGGTYPTLATVKTNIEGDLTKLLSGGRATTNIYYDDYKLGQQLDRSDLLRTALNVEGVDRIDTWTVNVSGTPVTTIFNPQNSEYLRLGSMTWL